MPINKSVFWDDLAKDLEDPKALASFLEFGDYLRGFDDEVNKILEIGAPRDGSHQPG
jgi:hypothetical protein